MSAAYMRRWRAANPEASRAIHKRWRVKKKQQAIDHYGGRCVCCGEAELAFLTIDHVNGDGASERRRQGHRGGINTYAYLLASGWPEGYRVLCWNCNLATYAEGECPHARRAQD